MDTFYDFHRLSRRRGAHARLSRRIGRKCWAMLPPLLRTRLRLLLPTASQRTAAKSAPSRRSKNRSEQGEDLQSQTSPSRGTGEDVRSQLPKSGKGKEARQAARSGTGEETRQVCPVEEDVKEEAANRDDEDMGQAQNALEEGQWDALKR